MRRKEEELGELKQFERILSHLDKFAKPAATKLGQTSKNPPKMILEKLVKLHTAATVNGSYVNWLKLAWKNS